MEIASEETWWRFARECASATFFHTPAWANAFSATFGYRPVCWSLRTRGGAEVLFPAVEIPGGLAGGFSAVSMPAGTYGGPLSDQNLTKSDRRELAVVLLRTVTSLSVAGNPFSKERFVPARSTRRSGSTRCLWLDRPFSDVFASFDKGHRRSTHYGKRQGVRVRSASTVDDWNEYFELYEQTLQRWGSRATSRYPHELFARLMQLSMSDEGMVTLWVATEEEDRIVAGAIVFYWNGKACWWHGSSLSDYWHLKPNHVLQAAIIEDAISRDCDVYDMGPSGGHEGVEDFKRRFGAIRLSFGRFSYSSTRHRLTSRALALLRRDRQSS